MDKQKQRWDAAQESERQFWSRQDMDDVVVKEQTYHYKDILKTVPFEIKESSRILEVGVGPSGGIVSLLRGEKIVGIDPLIDWYKDNEIYRKFFTRKDIEYINGTIEEFMQPVKFDIIFMINTLDHIEDLDRTKSKLHDLLEDNGYLVITVYCFENKYIRSYYNMFGRYFDICHPHHFSTGELRNIFRTYDVIEQKDITRHIPYKEKKIIDVMQALFLHPTKLFRLPIFLLKKINVKIQQEYLFILQKI